MAWAARSGAHTTITVTTTEAAMLRANYHQHTTFCDGRDSAEDMVRAAVARRFEHVGFSGHMDPDIHMDWPAYVAEVTRLRAAYANKVDVLLGVELDAVYDPACCPGAEYVIGSAHFMPGHVPGSIDTSAEQTQDICDELYGGDWYAMARDYFALQANRWQAGDCTFIGHFDLVTRFNDQTHALDELDPRYLSPAKEAMEVLAAHGIPFEINCGAVNRGRKSELYPRRELLRHLHDVGGQIVISADAHQAELIDGCFSLAVATAMECDFTHTNILVHEQDGSVGWRQLALDTL